MGRPAGAGAGRAAPAVGLRAVVLAPWWVALVIGGAPMTVSSLRITEAPPVMSTSALPSMASSRLEWPGSMSARRIVRVPPTRVGLATCGVGTVTCALHFLQVVFLPAWCGETLYFVPHAGHGKTMLSDIVVCSVLFVVLDFSLYDFFASAERRDAALSAACRTFGSTAGGGVGPRKLSIIASVSVMCRSGIH